MTKIALACGAALLGTVSVAQAELSANIGVTSNYMWRGITLSDEDAAISGGVDYTHESGFYLGTWASSTTSEVGTEVDLYGGFAGSSGDVGYDVGIVGYLYPNEKDISFTEIYGKLSWKWIEGGVYYTVSSDIDEGAYTDGDLYYYVGASYELQDGWSLGATIGYYDFADDGEAGVGDISYMHYEASVTKDAGDFGALTMSIGEAEEESGSDDTHVWVSWTKSF